MARVTRDQRILSLKSKARELERKAILADNDALQRLWKAAKWIADAAEQEAGDNALMLSGLSDRLRLYVNQSLDEIVGTPPVAAAPSLFPEPEPGA